MKKQRNDSVSFIAPVAIAITCRRVPCGSYVIHYRAAGRTEGVPIVLVHGLAVSSDYLQPTMRELARRGFRVYAPDLPGHGLSSRPERALNVPDAAQVLYEWCDLLGIVGKVHLAGHSMGGQIAIEAAVRHPKLARSLTLIGATGGGSVRSLRREIGGLLLDAFLEKPGMVALAIRNYFKSGILHSIGLARHHIEDEVRPKLAQLNDLPVLIVWAERDMVAPLEFGRELRRSLARACLMVVPRSSHAGLVYATPAFLGEAMRRLIEEPFLPGDILPTSNKVEYGPNPSLPIALPIPK